MDVLDYGLWILTEQEKVCEETGAISKVEEVIPFDGKATLEDLEEFFTIKWQGKKLFWFVVQEEECTVGVLDPVFQSFSRNFVFKNEFSNKPLSKILKRVTKRYKSSMKKQPGFEKSQLSGRLDNLLEVLCS